MEDRQEYSQWLRTPEREYYDLERRSEIRDGARKLRKQYLRYKEAEIIYSMSHTLCRVFSGVGGRIPQVLT